MRRPLSEVELQEEQEELNSRYESTFYQLKEAQLRQLTKLVESIPTFAQDVDEKDWRTLTNSKDTYNEQELRDMRKVARKLYYTNSGARGLIDTVVNFVIGKDASVVSEDTDETVQTYFKEFQLVNRWDLRMKEVVRRCLRDGEMFLRMFPGNPDLAWFDDYPLTTTVPEFRFIDPNDITDKLGKHTYGIYCDPNDIENPLIYYRYAHMQHTQLSGSNIAAQVTTEEIPASEIIHTKILVDVDVKRGLSYYTAIAPYLVKYQEWLDDRITLNKIRTMFNLIMKVTGNPQAIANKFEDAAVQPLSGGSTTTATSKKMPRSGSVLVSSPGIEYEFANLQIRAQDTKEDGRAIELMVGKGTGLTEYVVRGDASNANYASSMVSESPMVRNFEAWQDIFAKPVLQVHRKALRWGVEQGLVPTETERVTIDIDPVTGEETIQKEKGRLNFDIKVTFAALVHRDLEKESKAYAIHTEHGWDSDRSISGKLGNDYDQVQREKRREDLQNLSSIRREVEAMKKQLTSGYRNPNVDPETGRKREDVQQQEDDANNDDS
jgi:capsid protein